MSSLKNQKIIFPSNNIYLVDCSYNQFCTSHTKSAIYSKCRMSSQVTSYLPLKKWWYLGCFMRSNFAEKKILRTCKDFSPHPLDGETQVFLYDHNMHVHFIRRSWNRNEKRQGERRIDSIMHSCGFHIPSKFFLVIPLPFSALHILWSNAVCGRTNRNSYSRSSNSFHPLHVPFSLLQGEKIFRSPAERWKEAGETCRSECRICDENIWTTEYRSQVAHRDQMSSGPWFGLITEEAGDDDHDDDSGSRLLFDFSYFRPCFLLPQGKQSWITRNKSAAKNNSKWKSTTGSGYWWGMIFLNSLRFSTLYFARKF